MTEDADHTIHVLQGAFQISSAPQTVLSTVLGSCVAVCLWDAVQGVGGMNHFLLPFGPKAPAAMPERYGVHAMELLINGLLKAGARRDRLQAKLFGGARLSAHRLDIGLANAEFARTFLAAEGIPCRAQSLGGGQARRVLFWPATGQARQMLVPDSLIAPPPTPPARQTLRVTEIELF